MPERIELQPAYILHTRPYRDTSLLVDAFTENYGKVSLVARGARGSKKSRNNQRYLLQPFMPILLSWQGNHSLKTLIGVEPARPAIPLTGTRLYSALYVNELLTYLLPQDDPIDASYKDYEQVLSLFVDEACDIELCLRHFEFNLLEALGYGINFHANADTGQAIESSKQYFLIQQHGFVLAEDHPDIRSTTFSGQYLLPLQHRDFSSIETRQYAKLISRLSLQHLLGYRKLKSRELFLKLHH